MGANSVTYQIFPKKWNMFFYQVCPHASHIKKIQGFWDGKSIENMILYSHMEDMTHWLEAAISVFSGKMFFWNMITRLYIFDSFEGLSFVQPIFFELWLLLLCMKL